MAHTAPFTLASFPTSGGDGPGPTWSLAGSLAVHAMLCVVIMGLRVMPSLEQPLASHVVDLVEFAERLRPAMAPPSPPPPTLQQRVASIAVPDRYDPSFEQVVTTPDVPPERVEDTFPTVESLRQLLAAVRIPAIGTSSPAPTHMPPPPLSDRLERVTPAHIDVPPPPPLVDVNRETPPVPAPPSPVPPERDVDIAALRVPDVPPSASYQSVMGRMENGASSLSTNLSATGISSPQAREYWARLKGEIDREWVVPVIQYHEPLKTVLTFRVTHTGQVARLTVDQSSGSGEYDVIARRAVLAAGPFPPFPMALAKPYLDINFTFIFQPDR